MTFKHSSSEPWPESQATSSCSTGAGKRGLDGWTLQRDQLQRRARAWAPHFWAPGGAWCGRHSRSPRLEGAGAHWGSGSREGDRATWPARSIWPSLLMRKVWRWDRTSLLWEPRASETARRGQDGAPYLRSWASGWLLGSLAMERCSALPETGGGAWPSACCEAGRAGAGALWPGSSTKPWLSKL